MVSLYLISIILAAGFGLLLALYASIRRPLLFKKSGLSYFKVLLKQRGIDTSNIPDAALFDIVRSKIISARTCASLSSRSRQRPRNWRIQLAEALEAEADLIVLLMTEGPERQPRSDAAVALIKYGIIQPAIGSSSPALTLEQFSEAARKGTLYTELNARRLRRENS